MSLADRILGSFDRLASSAPAREGMPDARYLALWSYSVTSATETTFEGRALSPRNPQPDLKAIPNMPGVPGTLLKPKVGSIVGVMFLDGDPAQPRVVSWDRNTAELVTVDATTLLKLGPSAAAVEVAGGGPAIHRVGDLGQGGTFAASANPLLTYTGEDGLTWTIAGAVSGAIVNFTVAPVTAGPPGGKVITKATTGSTKGTCG